MKINQEKYEISPDFPQFLADDNTTLTMIPCGQIALITFSYSLTTYLNVEKGIADLH